MGELEKLEAEREKIELIFSLFDREIEFKRSEKDGLNAYKSVVPVDEVQQELLRACSKELKELEDARHWLANALQIIINMEVNE